MHAATKPPIPDLILLDVMMPEMNGYNALKELQRTLPALMKDTPVIFITASDSPDDEEMGLALGAVDYILKPLNISILRARIGVQLELKQTRQMLLRQNAYLEEEITRRMCENEIIKDASLYALALIAETRDPETGNHIKRTQAYIDSLARQLSKNSKYAPLLSESRIKIIVKSAPLHDIGKVGIKDDILLKPGRLSPEEFDVMKTHPLLGKDAIRNAIMRAAASYGFEDIAMHEKSYMDFLEVAAEIAEFHHEKWDGSGYPHGLSGDDIPLCAQLMAVADVFDALSSRRVYKEAFERDEVFQIICSGRNVHFNPDIVDAFINVHETLLAIAEHYADYPDESGIASCPMEENARRDKP